MAKSTAVGHGDILALTHQSLGQKIAAQAHQVVRLEAALQTAREHLADLRRLRNAATTHNELTQESTTCQQQS